MWEINCVRERVLIYVLLVCRMVVLLDLLLWSWQELINIPCKQDNRCIILTMGNLQLGSPLLAQNICVASVDAKFLVSIN